MRLRHVFLDIVPLPALTRNIEKSFYLILHKRIASADFINKKRKSCVGKKMALPVSRGRQEHTRLTGLPVDFGQICEKKEFGNKSESGPKG